MEERADDDAAHRCCSRHGSGQRQTPHPAAEQPLDFADVPSGKGEPQEPVTATAVREPKEETGVVAAEAALRLVDLVHGSWGAEATGMLASGFHLVVVVRRALPL
ncbi:NUDIX domain-containing protein [Streptomyces sp. NBC_00847]|uniref:NUDIX domain-containing protein n=1 Tax=Streptomyces sp. NBC_00847 TaxID=2975850 RepID=UPI00338D82EB